MKTLVTYVVALTCMAVAFASILNKEPATVLELVALCILLLNSLEK